MESITLLESPASFGWTQDADLLLSSPRMEPAYDQPIADIAQYIFHYEIDEADENVWARARMALLDTLGCAIETAATSDECRRLLGLTRKGMIVPDGFRVPGTDLQVDPLEGAFDFGVLIRYLDHNDALGGAEWGHPSDNIAAILAVMDWLSRMSASARLTHTGPPLTMRTLLIAVIKAYEIQGCYQMLNAFNAYGIDHVVLVKLASAAVVSWLLGLTEEQTMACISHVWMDGQPTRVYRERDNTIPRKGWAAGDAVRRAVQLAFYVQAGQPGSPGALSSKPWGFWARTFGEAGFQFAQPFGTWTIQNVLFKAMPVEGHAVSAVEAILLQMRRFKAKGLSNPAQDIKQMDLRTTAAAELIINKRGPLRNAADRDHCIQYAVALACLKGSAPDAADYLDTSPWATNHELKCLMERITVSSDAELTRDYLDLDKKSIGTGVTVHLKDQSVLPEILVEYPMGHARNPESNAFVEDKFLQNMARTFSKTKIAQIAGAVHHPDLPVSNFVDLLACPASQPQL